MTAPANSQQIDMDQVTAQTVQQLGGQLAMLTLELNAQVAARTALGQQLEEKDAELARLRQSVDALRAAAADRPDVDEDQGSTPD